MNLSEFKAAAAERGIDWQSLRGLYDSMRAEETAAHDRRRALVSAAYAALRGDSRGGAYKAGHRHEFAGGDYSSLPGFDEVSAALAAEFSDLLPADNPAPELWAILTEPAPEAPAAADCMARALERGAAECPAAPGSPRDLVSIPQAARLADVSEVWLRRLVKAGKIAGYRVGKSYVVSAAAAARFKRHPTAGRPRRAHVDLSSVPF